jgi:hypothetical protein
MDPTECFSISAYELLQADAELAHLCLLIPGELNSQRVLPLAYWRGRVTALMNAFRLLPCQVAIAYDLLEQIDRVQET